jgi:formiminotetrahydrofolate cyclodeaminase
MDRTAPGMLGMRLDELTEALASAHPAPGGGAAAAIAAALGASLTAMVARLSVDRPRYAEHGELHREAIAASDASRIELLALAEADANAYAAYRAARAMPSGTDDEQAARDVAARDAARAATEVPLQTVFQPAFG